VDSSLLKKIPIFKGLTPQDLEKLETIIEEKSFPAGHQLFHTGDPSDAFYIIESGSVRIVREEPDGRELEIATLREGDFFGEMGVLENTERSAGAVISESAVLLEVERHEFHRFMAINPSISMKVISTVSKRYKVKASTSAGEQPRPPGKVVSVFTATGGVGNSLVIANLAAATRRLTGDLVAVVDLDLMFGDQTGIFNIKGSRSLSAIVDEPEIGLATLENLVEETKAGVDLIPAPLKAIEAETVTPDLVRVVIEVLKGRYDWIFLDTANSVSELNLSAYEISDERYYLVTPEVLAIKNARRWLSILEMINLDVSGLQLIINKELSSDVSMRDDIAKSMGCPIRASLPYDYKTARNGLNLGQLPVLENQDSKLGKALLELARDLCGKGPLEAPDSERPQSLWGRLTSWTGG